MSTFINWFGGRGSGNGQFLYPNGVGVDSSGNVYIVDSGNSRIQKFDSTGTFYVPGTGERNPFDGSEHVMGALVRPTKIAVSTETNTYNKVYVIDELHVDGKSIVSFKGDGTFLSSLSIPTLYNPVDIAVTSGNSVLLCLADAQEVTPHINKYDVLGQLVGTLSLDNMPTAIAIDDRGTNSLTPKLWVGFRDHTIARYVLGSGVKELVMGHNGSGNGEFNDIVGMFVDSNGNLYVVDEANYRVQKFDSNGNYLEKFGTFGSNDDQFNDPMGVGVSGTSIFVSDSKNYRINKYLADTPPTACLGVKPDNMSQDDWNASSKNVTTIRNPINTTKPTMRWQIATSGTNNPQTALYVQIARNQMDLGEPAQVFDSGVVELPSVSGIGTFTVPDSGDLIYAGDYYYRVKIRDEFGLWSPWSNGAFTIVTDIPINPYIKIQESPQTNKITVNLRLNVDGSDITEMIIADNPEFTGGNWVTYATYGQYSFTGIVGEMEVTETLYAKFRNRAWNESDVVMDRVIIDTMPPHDAQVTLRVPTVAQYFDIDRVATNINEYVLFNGYNDYQAVDLISNEDITHNINNTGATYVYYLLNGNLRKKDGNYVDVTGSVGTLTDFNNGVVDFHIDNILGGTLTFIVNPASGTLTFNRELTADEKQNGVFVSYRTGKKTFTLSQPLIMRDIHNAPFDATDQELYVFMGGVPVPEDITITGVSNINVVSVYPGSTSVDSANLVYGTITFDRSPTIEEIGVRTTLSDVAGRGDVTIKVIDIFGFYEGCLITIANNTKVYRVTSVNISNRELYLNTGLVDAYPIGTSINTVNQLGVGFYYGQKEFVVSNTTIEFSLNVIGASEVYIDGDVIADPDKTKTWIPYAATKIVSLLPLTSEESSPSWHAFGRRDVYFRFRDTAGNETNSITIPGGVWLDLRLPEFPPAPLMPVVIQEGSFTNSQVVHLKFNIVSPDGIQFLVQGDVVREAGVTYEWVDYPYNTIVAVMLSDTDGLKNIEVYFRTASKNTVGPIVVSTTLDTSVPLSSGITYYYRLTIYA